MKAFGIVALLIILGLGGYFAYKNGVFGDGGGSTPPVIDPPAVEEPVEPAPDVVPDV